MFQLPAFNFQQPQLLWAYFNRGSLTTLIIVAEMVVNGSLTIQGYNINFLTIYLTVEGNYTYHHIPLIVTIFLKGSSVTVTGVDKTI